MDKDYVTTYERHVASLKSRLGRDEALRKAIGGDFIPVGKLEYHLLRSLGLTSNHLVVDVGCGSGRLACHLAPFSDLHYIGCDVVQELLDYADELCQRKDFHFIRTDGTNIPCEDTSADFVTFFSVFTHLHHEDTFKYLLEGNRVLKPGGRLVLSFLEFELDFHWAVFADSVARAGPGQHLNQFFDRHAIRAWAKHSGFVVESIRGGDTAHIPIPELIEFENGTRYGNYGTFGQSVAVLVKE